MIRIPKIIKKIAKIKRPYLDEPSTYRLWSSSLFFAYCLTYLLTALFRVRIKNIPTKINDNPPYNLFKLSIKRCYFLSLLNFHLLDCFAALIIFRSVFVIPLPPYKQDSEDQVVWVACNKCYQVL